MKFEEIIEKVKNKEITLRWDLTPQKYSAGIEEVEISSQEDIDKLQKIIASRTGCYFYIDVWDMKAQLFLACNDKEGNSKAEAVENIPPSISYEDLLGAVEEAGGAINRSGWYPINNKIETLLKESFKNKRGQ